MFDYHACIEAHSVLPLAFGRGNIGFLVINNEDTIWTSTFSTSLPDGTCEQLYIQLIRLQTHKHYAQTAILCEAITLALKVLSWNHVLKFRQHKRLFCCYLHCLWRAVYGLNQGSWRACFLCSLGIRLAYECKQRDIEEICAVEFIALFFFSYLACKFRTLICHFADTVPGTSEYIIKVGPKPATV